MIKKALSFNTIEKLLLNSIFKTHIGKAIILLSILVPPIMIIALNIGTNISDTIFANSYLIIWIYFFFGSIVVGFGIFTIFVKSRTNNLDLYLYITSNSKVSLVNMKIKVVMSLVILINSSSLILSSLILLILGLPGATISLFGISLLLMNLSFLLLTYSLVLVGIYLKPFIATISIGVITILVSGLPLASRMLSANVNEFTYNQQANVTNYLNILEFDETNTISSSKYGLTTNVNNEENGLTTEYQLSGINAFSRYNLFDVTTMPSISMMSLSNNYSNYEDVINSRFSTNEATINLKPTVQSSDTIIAVPAGGYNPFIKSTSTLSEDIISRLEELHNSRNLNDVDYSSLLNKISNNINWTGVLTDSDIQILSHLSGIVNSNSPFYWTMTENALLASKLTNVPAMIEESLGIEARELMTFLWSDIIAFDNIFNLGNVVPISDIVDIYPSLRTYDEFGEIHEQDMHFFKNNLTRQVYDQDDNIIDFQVLNMNGLYMSTTDTISNITGDSIVTRDDWDQYLINYSTMNNMEDLYSKLATNIGPTTYQMQFRDNVVNVHVIDGLFEEEFENVNKLQWTWFAVYPILLILMGQLINNKVSKKDVI